LAARCEHVVCGLFKDAVSALEVVHQYNDALFIQFVENQGSLHVSSIICSSSGGDAQTAFGIIRAYVSQLAVARLHCNCMQYTKRSLCIAF
jgi:hypothetical protein